MMTEADFKRYFDKFVTENPTYGLPDRHDQGKIAWAWSTGSASGGNCYNDDPPTYSASGETEPSCTPLDEFLTEFFTNITFLQYMKLSKIIKTDSHHESEYYGNYTEYAVRYVEYSDLLDALVELNQVEP